METIERALAAEPVSDLGDARDRYGWGGGLEAALRLGPIGCIEHLEASGLRGRGGAGFPTGRKWRTVAEHSSPELPATVVVNAAEGEPGSFKDREILRRDPYRVIEGALVAAVAVDADQVVVATKRSFRTEIERLRVAMDEVRPETDGIGLDLVEGPGEYLYGEESGLLEVVAGRPPFPRIAPPWRAGVDETDPSTKSAAPEPLAAPGDATPTPPALVNNVETLANVGAILARGPSWFREVGTEASPGTVVCTISGRTRRDGVAEVAMGTPLRTVVEGIGGGAEPGRRLEAAVSGVANPVVRADDFDVGLSYEAMREIGSGLGAAGFLVFDDRTDPIALAHGVARFLAVESCGQCTPCKLDGLVVAEVLDRLRRGKGSDLDLVEVHRRLEHVTEGARCNLALQHQQVVGSVFDAFGFGPEDLARVAEDGSVEPIVPIADLVEGRAVLELEQLDKQPDWTFAAEDSGQTPAARLTEATGGTGS